MSPNIDNLVICIISTTHAPVNDCEWDSGDHGGAGDVVLGLHNPENEGLNKYIALLYTSTGKGNEETW